MNIVGPKPSYVWESGSVLFKLCVGVMGQVNIVGPI